MRPRGFSLVRFYNGNATLWVAYLDRGPWDALRTIRRSSLHGRLRTVRVPILCYHRIGDSGRSLNVAEDDFTRQLRFLGRRYRLGLLRDFPQERTVVLTFDDVYVSTAEALLRASAVGTIFPVPKYVGGRSEWDGDSARPLADWDTLAALRDRGFELGNHTFSHADLSMNDSPEEEIIQGAAEWEPVTFAYPFGRYDQRAVDTLQGLGYRAGVTTATGIATEKSPRLELPRLKVSYSDRVAGLLYKLYLRPRLPK